MRRDDFAHGNPVQEDDLKSGDTSLFMVASSLYRMALATALPLVLADASPGEDATPDEIGEWIAARMEFNQPQKNCEHAILKALGLDS